VITEEERQSIINEAVEKALLMLPEVVGNLITNQVSLIKINRQFYSKYPEFAKNKDIVASVIEMVEGNNPGVDYEELLKRAVPMIKERIKTVQNLDKLSVTKPNRDLSKLPLSDHGEL